MLKRGFDRASALFQGQAHAAPFDPRGAASRLPIRRNHLIEKESLRFKELEHALIGIVDQLFRNML
jgi:hypothetical protein